MRKERTSWLILRIAALLLLVAGKAYAGIGTTVPISAEMGTSIAGDLFPVTVEFSGGNLFLTEPVLLFLDDQRIGMQVRVQAYDHRPAEGIAISEMGRAQLSGTPDYDPASRQVLLHNPEIDKLEFDRSNAVTRRLLSELQAAWSIQVSNPIRSEIPPNPYILPFKDNIRGLSFDGDFINLEIVYE